MNSFQDVKLNQIWFWLYRLKWVLIKRNDRIASISFLTIRAIGGGPIAPSVKKLISVVTYDKSWTTNAIKFVFQFFFFLFPSIRLFYSLFRFKSHKSKFKNFINEKFKKRFYFSTCILPDFVSYESPKEFVRNSF